MVVFRWLFPGGYLFSGGYFPLYIVYLTTLFEPYDNIKIGTNMSLGRVQPCKTYM